MTSHYGNPFSTKLGQLIKDFGHGMSRCAHSLRTVRPYVACPRHSNIVPYRFAIPNAADAAFVAPNAIVQGNVVLGHGASVFYSTSIKCNNLRDATVVGDHTVILDRVSIMGSTKIGDNCHIGIGANLDSCIIKNNVYIGHGATVSYGCVIEEGAIIAAGSVLPMDTRVGPGELWAGNTAEKIDMVTHEQAEEVSHIVHSAYDSAEAHQASINQQFTKNETFDLEWLHRIQGEVEKQQTSVAIKEAADIPLEARRFVQPRVHTRRREQTLRASNSSSNIAPWFYKGPNGHRGNV